MTSSWWSKRSSLTALCVNLQWLFGQGKALTGAWILCISWPEMIVPDTGLNFRYLLVVLWGLVISTMIGIGVLHTNSGVAAYMTDERNEVLLEISEFLKTNYIQYGRAVAYLEQLAGARAMPRKPAEQLHFMLVPQTGIQRGAIVLGNPEPHTLHNMRVTFHRFHWQWWRVWGKNRQLHTVFLVHGWINECWSWVGKSNKNDKHHHNIS